MSVLKGRTLLPGPLRRRDVTTYHEDHGSYTVHHLPVICTPYPSKWEHPIYWWRMRYLRRDIELHQDALDGTIDPETEQRFDAAMDDAFLFGGGGGV